MTGIIVVFVIVMFVVVFVALAKGTTGNFDRLVAKGIRARGIILRVATTGTKVSSGVRRFQQRGVYIDIEVPGQAPYELSTTLMIPANLVRDILPGATVELRIDPRNSNNIIVVGPGVGFAASLLTPVAPPQN